MIEKSGCDEYRIYGRNVLPLILKRMEERWLSPPCGQLAHGGTSYPVAFGHGITCLFPWYLRLSGASVLSKFPPFYLAQLRNLWYNNYEEDVRDSRPTLHRDQGDE